MGALMRLILESIKTEHIFTYLEYKGYHQDTKRKTTLEFTIVVRKNHHPDAVFEFVEIKDLGTLSGKDVGSCLAEVGRIFERVVETLKGCKVTRSIPLRMEGGKE
jgi:hypothetical protein